MKSKNSENLTNIILREGLSLKLNYIFKKKKLIYNNLIQKYEK